MRRSDLTAQDGGWEGLLLEPERPARPALRVEVVSGRRLAILRDDEPVLLARFDDCYGVDYLRTGRHRSPVRPLRADEARRVRDLPGPPAARWAHRFARELAAAPGPLHTGRWVIRPWMPGSGVTSLLRPEHPDGYLDWFSGDTEAVLPLRDLSCPRDGRVSAYRKQARAGILPPVLLWWVSGLNAHVVLDGHDRLVAALAEDDEPPLLTLHRAHDRPFPAESLLGEYDRQVASLEQVAARGTAGARQALADLHRRWARRLAEAADGPARTRAWPMPGGPAAWTRLTAPHRGETRPWL